MLPGESRQERNSGVVRGGRLAEMVKATEQEITVSKRSMGKFAFGTHLCDQWLSGVAGLGIFDTGRNIRMLVYVAAKSRLEARCLLG